MSEPIIPREEVARQLAVPARVLVRYEARGLVQTLKQGEVEGYSPAEVRRIWSIVSYQRDLGINLAGVEAVLKLREHLAEVYLRLNAMAERLNAALDDGPNDNPNA
jgi:MerR family transcriptional regulator/heat shock protein HspR